MSALQDAVVVRQANSASGVIGKLLANQANGYNRFALVLEQPDGSRQGAIYRVQPSVDEEKLVRDITSDLDANDPVFKRAPIYKWDDIGSDFWLEEF